MIPPGGFSMLRLLTAILTVAAMPVIARADNRTTPEFATPTEAINHYIREGYTKAKIATPAARASDHEFLRRASIDLIGRVPTIEEVLDFERDSSPNKRSRLVQRLLHTKNYMPRVNGQTIKLEGGKELEFDYAEQHAQHWANIWTVWLMTRSGHPIYREQMRTWLESELLEGTNHKELTEKLLTATGKTNENGAVNFIIHQLGEATPNDKRGELGPFDAVPITSRVTKLFLGIQTNCTQCHDHPFNKEWVQADFWGVNAFFRQTFRDRTPTDGTDRRVMNTPQQVELRDDRRANEPQIVYYERRDGKLMASKPNFLKDLAAAEAEEVSVKPLPRSEGRTRREALAEYVTSHDNFARAYVNRMWGHFFGRGLNQEPSVDDFGSHNEVVHPELLDYLAAEFVKYNYDQKKLMEWICTSEPYSLSAVANKAYADEKYEPYFARMPLKALSPEVLYESLMTVTGSKFSGDRVERDIRGRGRQSFEEKLVANFGDDEGNEVVFNGTVVQALLMMNGTELNGQISRRSPDNPVNRIIARNTRSGAINSRLVIEELYLTALGRRPTSTEMSKVNAIMNRGAKIEAEAPRNPRDQRAPNRRPGQQPGSRMLPPSGPNDPTFYQDLFWTLLNTNEFILNH